jgi:hypothetical protein
MKFVSSFALLLIVALFSTTVSARQIPIANPPAAGDVNLPYGVNDNQGNQWRIYPGGWLQQQGNMPLYSQAGMLTINGNQLQQNNNRGKIDPKTGELILEGFTAGNISITRKILISKDEGFVRYVDILKNTQKQDQALNLSIQTNMNYGVQSGQMVPDPKRKDQNMAWVAMTHANRAVAEVFSGKGAKNAFAINWPQGNSYVQATMQLNIPGGKEIAIMHLHSTSASMDSAAQWVNGLNERKILSSLARDVRRNVINFAAAETFIGDYEILRGDVLDVLELRTGDQIKGTIKDPSFKIATFYGNVELPADRVISIINVGEFRPRQLLVTTQGEIFGGKLAQPTIAVELSSGQVTQIPLSQILRAGFRKRANEPEEWTFDKPLVLMRSGDRINVQIPAAPISVTTRYGFLKLDPQTISSIVLQSEDHGVHDIFLTDGTRFAGLVAGDEFELKLAGVTGQDQLVRFPLAAMLRFQFAAVSDDKDSSNPQLDLTNNDSMVGTLTGQLKLDTAFDTLSVNASEIQKLTHPKGPGIDVQITLWDQTVVSGQLQAQEVECKLNCGLVMKIPVALIDQYTQPAPQPSAVMLEKIKTLVTQLNADDWKQREQAEAQIVALGSGVLAPLRQLRPSQPPEAQQRIDSILKKVGKDTPAAGSPPATAVPAMID